MKQDDQSILNMDEVNGADADFLDTLAWHCMTAILFSNYVYAPGEIIETKLAILIIRVPILGVSSRGIFTTGVVRHEPAPA